MTRLPGFAMEIDHMRHLHRMLLSTKRLTSDMPVHIYLHQSCILLQKYVFHINLPQVTHSHLLNDQS